ncbi:DoxX family protein [Actinomycetospora termitidis]|uniref:DoxX family protein n=1 Tax=Actinomycetospora termitidis TaxID=3053470 RepID=A0ABT7M2L2_9PSEU|nr:DoxX family protein [Actinomycetospora sp. Odt1-22]MDL5154899.1 DoxX family protein [Actinomycetospora sp. Odt1-22]
MLVRRLARPMLAAIFIKGGIDTLLNPEPRVGKAAPKIQQAENLVGDKLPPQAPTQPDQLVRIDAGVKIGAGVLLALGKFPRIASLALAASVIPTTVVGHAFWEYDGEDRTAQEQHFLKNLGLLGGLILAAVDTEGKPSLGWRARRASRKLAKQTRELTGSSSDTDFSEFAESAKSAAGTAGATARDAVDVAIGKFAA